MPRYDFRCNACGLVMEATYKSGEIDSVAPGCPRSPCGGTMELVWLPRPYRCFPSFVTTHIDGKPREITSLHQIRQIEKERQSTNFIWEPGSFDSKHGDS